MKINQTGSDLLSKIESSKGQATSRSQKNSAEAQHSVAEGSRPEISGRAREMSKAKEVAMSADDIRAEKIAKLKERIASGQYNIKPDAIADRMVKEHSDTHGLG